MLIKINAHGQHNFALQKLTIKKKYDCESMFPLAKTTFADGACYYGKDDTKCTYAMCSDSTAIAKGNKNC